MVCNQPPTNPHNLRELFLERYSEDWGVYCEGPTAPFFGQKRYVPDSGGSLECSIEPGNSPYASIYCYRDLLLMPNATSFSLSFSFWIPPTTCNNAGGVSSVIQGLEFTFNKFIIDPFSTDPINSPTKRYEFALQYQNVWDGSTGTHGSAWHYWIPSPDGKSGRWENLSPVFEQCLQGNTWHTFLFEGEINSSDQVVYKAFTLDGVIHDLSLLPPQNPTPSNIEGKQVISVQLDSNWNGDPYKLLLNKVNFIVK